MLLAICKGSPYEIGFIHGKATAEAIARCIAFYSKMFLKKCNLSWKDVLQVAKQFAETIRKQWPAYYTEMEGIAAGSNRPILDIIALNVRTEIAFGQFTDGCTSAAWTTTTTSLLGQNWDWETEQAQNLVFLTIIQDGLPTIKMITEAGLIGKIGFNSSGVGVCLNAIRAKGLDPARMPVHVALRKILESSSVDAAADCLETFGVASSAHFLIADSYSAIGLESTSSTFFGLQMDSGGRIFHSNHLLGRHEGVRESSWMPDSESRLQRIETLADELQAKSGEKGVGLASFAEMFKDEENFPAAICRAEQGISEYATLFSICMDLKAVEAVVRIGRPSCPTEILDLSFDHDP